MLRSKEKFSYLLKFYINFIILFEIFPCQIEDFEKIYFNYRTSKENKIPNLNFWCLNLIQNREIFIKILDSICLYFSN